MWMEVQALFNAIAIILIGIILIFTIFVNFLLAFLCIFAIGMCIMGPMVFGYMYTKSGARWLVDSVGPGHELCLLFDRSGNFDVVKTKKGPFDTRQFMRYGKPATIINTGDYQIRTHNGNKGFVGHEDVDTNINPLEAAALDKTEGDDVKEIYDRLPHVVVKELGAA